MNRRTFLKSIGIGILGLAISSIPFNKNVMVQSVLEKKLQRETVTHTSGLQWSWEALYEGDYVPMTNEIFDQLETDTSNLVSGSFSTDPKIATQSGTYTNENPIEKRKGLINQFEKNIDKDNLLLTALENLLGDNSSYVVLEQFLKDGGKIEAWPSSGRYTPDPLVIAVGTNGTIFDIEKTLYHESLHYAFDKINSVLFESHNSGGADHQLISPLEDRLRIVQQIKNKQIPIFDEHNSGLYGSTTDGKIGEDIKEYVNQNDLDGLKDYINSDKFQRGYVRSSMTRPLSSNDCYDQHPEDREKNYRLTDGQINDIAFLNAVNGALIQSAINIGVTTAKSKSIGIKEAFETDIFQSRFQDFLIQYTKKIENSSIQPYTGAKF